MKKILAVDDDRLILELVNSALKTEGYEVYNASNVDEAVQLIDEKIFDFLITDIVMPPGRDGTKLMQYVKIKYPHMPVLAITGGIENAVDDYVHYADLFADYTLAKPFTKKDLTSAMADLME